VKRKNLASRAARIFLFKKGPNNLRPVGQDLAVYRFQLKYYEQPLKSVRATLVSVAGNVTRGMLLMSVVVMISEGEQSARPPLFGSAARALTVNGTGGAVGTE
jgi:hypothetical protein